MAQRNFSSVFSVLRLVYLIFFLQVVLANINYSESELFLKDHVFKRSQLHVIEKPNVQVYLRIRNELENLLLEENPVESLDDLVSARDNDLGKLFDDSYDSLNRKRNIFKLTQSDKTWDNDEQNGANIKKEEKEKNINAKRFQNEWLIHMTGSEELVKSIVSDLGYSYLGSVKGFENMHRISRPSPHSRPKRDIPDSFFWKDGDQNAQIFWAEQQYVKERTKRRTFMQNFNELVDDQMTENEIHEANRIKHRVKRKTRKNKPKVAKKSYDISKLKTLKYPKDIERFFNDKLWNHQWYLFDTRTRKSLPKLDLQVLDVWSSGITGKGVKVIVLDDGIEGSHSDIKLNYDASLSYDINDDDEDPTPKYDKYDTNAHGTMCAGEIVMTPNNFKCGVGIAHGAKLGGVRMLDGDVNDRVEGAALAFAYLKGDVLSCSWGPMDNGKVVEGPGKLAKKAIEEAALKGRNGLGTIIVWASGNGGHEGDNCNCDGYTSSIYTLSIGSASETGQSPWYGEACASTMAVAYSSGAYTDQKIATTSLHDKCTTEFSGTSAAAPLAAGIVALTLEANPLLNWRDVQHLVVRTSDWKPLSQDDGWKTNGRGFKFNSKFGFGILNANRLVKMAKEWTSVEKKHTCDSKPKNFFNSNITSGTTVKIDIEVDCIVKQLEHVQAFVTIEHSNRGSLQITLRSPSGTTTELLKPRENDKSIEGFLNWPFMSVHTWGEDPTGIWTIKITDTSESSESGVVQKIAMVIHGTA